MKNVETRARPAQMRLLSQVIAVHTALATATLAGTARWSTWIQ